MNTEIPLEKIIAINGKNYSDLTLDEINTLNYFRKNGRKNGVSISLISHEKTSSLIDAKKNKNIINEHNKSGVNIKVYIKNPGSLNMFEDIQMSNLETAASKIQ